MRVVNPVIDGEAHDFARLAYLVVLTLNDESLKQHHELLRRLSGNAHAEKEDVLGLARDVESVATEIGFHPILLAACLIHWAAERESDVNKTEGPDDWFNFPHFLTQRNQLASEIADLSSDLASITKGISEEPELEIALAVQKSSRLHKRLKDLHAAIRGAKTRRSRLFYTQSRLQLEAYYWLKVRKVHVDDSEFLELFQRDGEVFELSDRVQRERLRKRVNDSADQVQKLVDELLAEYGVSRKKRPYKKSKDL